MSLSPHQRIIHALDYPSRGEALDAVHELKHSVGLFKIGLKRFLARDGSHELVEQVKQAAPNCGIMLDLKIFDVSDTRIGAIESIRDLPIDFLTVEGGSGIDHLKVCVDAAQGKFGILAITVLTSMNRQMLLESGTLGRDVENVVHDRAACAVQAGCAGIVCSGEETAMLRRLHPEWSNFLMANPGIRPAGANVGSHKRSVTPTMAIRSGADYLIIGGPIMTPTDGWCRANVAQNIAHEIARAAVDARIKLVLD